MTTQPITLIGTTIHDERVCVLEHGRYFTVSIDSQRYGGTYASFHCAREFALTFVPAHRRAA